MLPLSGALQLKTSLAINERPIRSASGAYSTFDEARADGLAGELRARGQEQVPQALRAGLLLELLDHRQHHPRVGAREQLAVVGLLAWLDLALLEGRQALQELLRAG